MQEGFRYNALHVCARANQAEAAKLILDTIECLDFMKLMYPDESEESGWNRINNLSDMYINTPDKGVIVLLMAFTYLQNKDLCNVSF